LGCSTEGLRIVCLTVGVLTLTEGVRIVFGLWDVPTISSMCRRVGNVGIATGYRLDERGVGVRVAVGSRIFTSRSHPDKL
jgi:hypothetical protein